MARTSGLKASVSANTDPSWADMLKNAKWTFESHPIQATASGSSAAGWPYWNGNGTVQTTQPFTAPSVAPLPPGFTWPPPPDPYPFLQDYDINILKPTDDVPFRQIKLETPFGEFGVLWFDGENMADALERLAAEIRAALVPF